MKKIFIYGLAVMATMMLTLPGAKAIITDPDDYLLYDTGILSRQAVAESFLWPGINTSGPVSMKITSGISIKEIGAPGRGFKAGDDGANWGYPLGATVPSDATFWGIRISQGDSASFKYADFLDLQKKRPDYVAAHYWDYNKPENSYNTPTDSIIIRIPKTCDSIAIYSCGTNSFYGVAAYEKGTGLDEPYWFNNKVGDSRFFYGGARYHMYYRGGNWGFMYIIGFRPEHTGPGDSTDIVILGPHKDYFSKAAANEWTDSNVTNTVTRFDQLVDQGKIWRAERYGLWQGTSIARIKVYGKIEKGSIPPFEGVHSAWTLQYRPKESGTIDEASVITKANQLEATPYAKYASDLGVVRSLLTASSPLRLGYDPDFDQFPARLINLTATHDSTNYLKEAQQTNYFDLSFATTKFQDLKLCFDYAIRNGSDTLFAMAKVAGGNWAFLDTLYNSANPTSQMAHADVVLPADYANQGLVSVRLMMGKGTVNKAELYVANVKIYGFDDFYASADGAKKVAYITSAEDRVHVLDRSTGADANDKLLKQLLEDEDYTVRIFAKDEWSTLTNAEEALAAFKDYKVVVLSPYVEANSSIVSVLGSLVGQKPILNFSIGAMKKWYSGLTDAPDVPEDSVMVASSSLEYHPIYNDLTKTKLDNGTMILPAMMVADSVAHDLPGILGLNGGYSLLCGPATNGVWSWEDYTNKSAKLVFIAVPADSYNRYSKDGYTYITNAIDYLNSGSAFVEPQFNLVADGAVVSNVDELKQALAYDYGALNLSTVNVKMEAGEYVCAGDMVYSNSNFNLSPVKAGTVVIKGSMSTDTLALKTKSLVFNGITFEDVSALLTLKAKDKISSTLGFSNCTFNGVGSLVEASAADSSQIAKVSVDGNVFNAATGVLVNAAAPHMILNKVEFKENVVNNYTGSALVRMGFVYPGDTILSLEFNHNTLNGTNGCSLLDVTASPAQDSVLVSVCNNILYNAKDCQVVLPDTTGILYTDSLSVSHNLLIGSTLASNVGKGWVLDINATSLDESVLEGTALFTDGYINKLSPAYTAGQGRTYLGSLKSYAERTVPQTITVSTVPELSTALSIAIEGDIIELTENTEDSLGVYQLGNLGFTYPTNGAHIILRPAEGQSPVLFGNLAPVNASVNVAGITVDGLVWQDVTIENPDSMRITGFKTDTYSPFVFNGKGGKIGELHLTNCRFIDLQNQMIVRLQNVDGMTFGTIRADYCEFVNLGGNTADGTTAAHFFQFSPQNTYLLNNFIFVENIVKDFHGSQFFNISRGGSKDGDSYINVVINNNLFMRVGGNAPKNGTTTERNFLEFTASPVNCDVNVSIDNNIFWERWSGANYPLSLVALYDTAKVKSTHIEILKNYYEGDYYNSDETYGDNPMAATDKPYTENLTATGVAAEFVVRDEPLYWEICDDMIQIDDDNLEIGKSSAFYTMGQPHYFLKGEKYIGVGLSYDVVNSVEKTVEEEMAEQPMLFVRAGVVYLKVSEESLVEVFSISGQKHLSTRLEAGVHGLQGLESGLYIVRVNHQAAKVVVK